MSYYHCPHTGYQLRALREDPTGRYNPILLDDMTEPWWFGYAIGIAAGLVAFLIGWAVL